VWPAQHANYPGLPRTGWLPSGADRPATAAVTMLVNGPTRQGTANDGTLSTVHDALSPSCRLSSAFQAACNDRHRDNYRRSALSNGRRVGLLALYDIV